MEKCVDSEARFCIAHFPPKFELGAREAMVEIRGEGEGDLLAVLRKTGDLGFDC